MENKTFEFTQGQQRTLEQLNEFITSATEKIFILKGYAGTGKTTLVKEIIRLLKAKELSLSLMASTGRAAKILSNITGNAATTVHSAIYKYIDFNQNLEKIAEEREKFKVDKSGQLFLQFELTILPERKEKRFYIIDEASMIGNETDKSANQALFGSGQLLDDLLRYDPNGKFIFVGDICQLPPANEKFSPALNEELFMDYFYRMKSLGIHQDDYEFKERMRSDIYLNALRAVFGFALTCHKSQGGEWEHVYLDIPRNFPLNPTQETYQWLYTAMTRAKTQLYITDGFWIV